MKKKAKYKVLVLVHEDLVPPENLTKNVQAKPEWKTEYDIVQALQKLGHEVHVLGVLSDIDKIRGVLFSFKPHIVFNLLEEFDENIHYDQHIVSYLELKKYPYTGCNPRGLTLARDKALSKKILSYHRIKVPKFQVFPKNQKVSKQKTLNYPMIVKSLVEEASTGISQASVVNNFEDLVSRVQYIHEKFDTDAIAEQYIKGREFYVGIMGNKRLQILPVWELKLENIPTSSKKFATERVKWDEKYRKKYGIESVLAKGLDPKEIDRIQSICKKAYKVLGLNGYARIDIRYTSDQEIYIIEANPNPGIAKDDEFPDSAKKLGIGYKSMIAKILSLGLSWYESRQ
ncbi:MAG: ATP-grasp domain-containing protein [Bdellovibrionales bacterium]|nr:ATP-grasp domain-containing protein [Bdellovibrionales bacterium]